MQLDPSRLLARSSCAGPSSFARYVSRDRYAPCSLLGLHKNLLRNQFPPYCMETAELIHKCFIPSEPMNGVLLWILLTRLPRGTSCRRLFCFIQFGALMSRLRLAWDLLLQSPFSNFWS